MLRVCSSCKKEKELSEYYMNKSYKSGRVSSCKMCIKTSSQEHYKKNKDKHTEYWLTKQYGISLSDYAVLLQKQNGVCAICFTKCSTGKRLAVDHDHATRKVRGLLCTNCNTGIGSLKDSILMLKSATIYLETRS